MALSDLQFNEFNILVNNLKGSSGKVVHYILQKEFYRPQYDVLDNEEDILVDVKVGMIEKHSLDLIEVTIQSLSVEVKVRNLIEADYFLKICRLHDKINVKESKYEIVKGAIRLTLVKVKNGKWHCLHYHHPEVFKSFQHKVKTVMKSIPHINGVSVKSLLREQIWILEHFTMCGLDVLAYYLESPSVYKTLEQIIEELKVELKDPDETYGVVLHLLTMLLIKERKDYEDAHPEALKTYQTKAEKKEMKKTQKERKAETLKLNGNCFMKSSKYLEAIQSYTEAIDMDPQCPVYYLNRAIAYYNISCYTLTLEDAAKAISINPFYCKAYYYLGEGLLHYCVPDIALYAFKRAKLLEPLNRKIDDKIVETYEFRHNFHMFFECVQKNNEEGRERHLKGLLKVLDSSLAAERLLKHLCDKGLISQAKVEAKKLSKIHRFNTKIEIYFLAICSYYEDDEKKFNEYFNKYKSVWENALLANVGKGNELCDSIADIYANIRMGDEMYKNDLYKKAIEFYVKALINTDVIPMISSKLFLKIALAKKELKDKGYFFYILESLKHKNDNHEALAARGEFFMQEDSLELALKDFERAQGLCPCRRYTELIEKAKAKQMPEDNSAASNKSKCSNKKQASERRRKAIEKKEEGNKFFQNGNFPKAVSIYSEAIELDDSDAVFFSNRAAAYINLKKFNNAFQDCEKALVLDSSFAKGHFRLGQCYLAKGEIDEAISSLAKALKLKQKDEGIQKELQNARDVAKDIDKANKLFDDKQWEEAAKLYSSIVKVTEVAAEFYSKWMECLMSLGRFEEALILCDVKIPSYLECNHFKYHYNIGICYLHKRMLSFTNRHFNKALELDPHDENLKSVVELLREKSKYLNLHTSKECEKIVQKILYKLSNPYGCLFKESDLLLSKNKQKEGDSFFEKGEYTGALYCYTEALSFTPLNCSLYISRASCYFKMHKFRDALSEAKEAIDVDDRCIEALILIGNTELSLGKLEGSLNAFQKAENIDTQNKKVNLGFKKLLKLKNTLQEANLAWQTKELQKSYDLYKEAYEMAPASHAIYEKFVELHLEFKPFTIFPFNEFFHDFVYLDDFQLATDNYVTGRLHYMYGNDKLSITFLERATKADPSNEKYKKWLDKVERVFSIIDKTMGALMQNDFQSSLNYLSEATEITEGNPFLLSKMIYLTGFVKFKQKEIDEAIERFTKATNIVLEKVDPCDGDIFSSLYKDSLSLVFSFEEIAFKSAFRNASQVIISSLEKRANCYKLQDDYSKALEDYKELYKYTKDVVYHSICDNLTRIKNLKGTN